MADKTVGELVQAQSVQPSDLFVLEQNGVAKKLTGQTLENWLLSFADGHGGIQSIEQISSEGLVDRYRILLADQTAVFFNVTNGRAIASIVQKSQQDLERVYEISFNDGSVESFTVTDGRSVESIQLERSDGLDDFYIINYNDKTTSSFVVHNGAKGDPGTNMYIWIKYASQEPTTDSSSIGDLPDNWIGVYSGPLSAAPEDWTEYKWFEMKGQKGDTGDAATLQSADIEYLVSDSGTIVPSGSWSVEIPVVNQGKYLWTRSTIRFNTGNPIIVYSVAYAGVDGTGLVNSVNSVAPDAGGNVSLTAENVGARPNTWLPTIAEMGAAPAGYGLGTIGRTIKTSAELDALVVNYNFLYAGGNYNDSITIDGYTITYGYGRTDTYNETGGKQTLIPLVPRIDTTLVRYRVSGVWSEWEWENPPMVANEEYRTTERYLGKVVYTKLVQFGALPNNTEKSVTAMPAGASLIEAIGIGYGSSYNVAIPGYYSIQSFGSTRSSGALWISTTTDMSGYNGWIKIKYHKG